MGYTKFETILLMAASIGFVLDFTMLVILVCIS